jgi:hypothetical protein
MVDQAYVARRATKHSLRNQRAHVVFDAVRIALVGKASSQPVQQTPPAISFAKQQPTIDRWCAPAVETAHHFATSKRVKFPLPYSTCKRPSLRTGRTHPICRAPGLWLEFRARPCESVMDGR